MKGETSNIERPILFSGAMVRAILDGRKTQTRRVVKLQPVPDPARAVQWDTDKAMYAWESNSGKMGIFHPHTFKCPYGQPGDRLWVKETFQEVLDVKPNGRGHSWDYKSTRFVYAADGPKEFRGKWKPSIFCTRKASRILLEIVSVRVERVQEITDADAIAEGVVRFIGYYSPAGLVNGSLHCDRYARLWDSINGKRKEGKPDYSWAANPWVWVVKFRRVETEGAR